jgi:hypothetical protein
MKKKMLALSALLSVQSSYSQECDALYVNIFTKKLKCLEAIHTYDFENPACESLAVQNLGLGAAIGGTFGAYVSKMYFKGPTAEKLKKQVGADFVDNISKTISEIRSIQDKARSNPHNPDYRTIRLQEEIAEVSKKQYEATYQEFQRLISEGTDPKSEKFQAVTRKLDKEMLKAHHELKASQVMHDTDKKLGDLIKSRFSDEVKTMEKLQATSRVVWDEMGKMRDSGISQTSKEYQNLQRKYLRQLGDLSGTIRHNPRLDFVSRLYSISNQPISPGLTSGIEVNLRIDSAKAAKAQRAMNVAGKVTKTVATSGLFSFIGAMGWNAAEKEFLKSCQKDLKLTDQDLSLINGSSYLFSKAKIESKPLANGKVFSCQNIELDLDSLRDKISLPVSPGLCGLMKKSMGKIDNLVSQEDVDQLNVSCNTLKSPNFKLEGIGFGKYFTYNDGTTHIKAPFDQTTLWLDYSRIEVYSGSGAIDNMGTEQMRSEGERKYMSMKAYDSTSQVWQSELQSSCTEGSKGILPCKVVQAAMKARLAYFFNFDACKEEMIKGKKVELAPTEKR